MLEENMKARLSPAWHRDEAKTSHGFLRLGIERKPNFVLDRHLMYVLFDKAVLELEHLDGPDQLYGVWPLGREIGKRVELYAGKDRMIPAVEIKAVGQMKEPRIDPKFRIQQRVLLEAVGIRDSDPRSAVREIAEAVKQAVDKKVSDDTTIRFSSDWKTLLQIAFRVLNIEDLFNLGKRLKQVLNILTRKKAAATKGGKDSDKTGR